MKVLTIGLDAMTLTFLQQQGVTTEPQTIDTSEELVEWVQGGEYEAVIIDLTISGIGVYCARSLRARRLTTVIVGISQKSSVRVWGDERALFLENGGDDLLQGPANPRELVASLRAATRRFKGALLDVLEFESGKAHLKINLTTHSITVNEEKLHLTGKEAQLLFLFAASPGRVLSKEVILMHLYSGGVDDEPEMKIIDVFVCKLRAKLAQMHPDAGMFIETVWGRGYMLPAQHNRVKVGTEAA